jgi:hypothetical protein
MTNMQGIKINAIALQPPNTLLLFPLSSAIINIQNFPSEYRNWAPVSPVEPFRVRLAQNKFCYSASKLAEIAFEVW